MYPTGLFGIGELLWYGVETFTRYKEEVCNITYIMKSSQIKLNLSHAPNTAGVGRPYSEMLTYKPLTNNAVLRKM